MIDVWRIPLDRPANDSVLSEGERERAARFHFERDRRRFVAAHTALRSILSEYTSAPAASLRFEKAPQGKPFFVHCLGGRFFLQSQPAEFLRMLARDLEAVVAR